MSKQEVIGTLLGRLLGPSQRQTTEEACSRRSVLVFLGGLSARHIDLSVGGVAHFREGEFDCS